MCHNSCLAFATQALSPEVVAGRDVLEVGSCDINGGVRDIVQSLSPRTYVGVDILPGSGVDVLCAGDEIVARFGPERWDLVVCTEALEHVRDWRAVVGNLKQSIKREGHLLITTRSFGFFYHPHPIDNWRYERDDFAEIFSDLDILRLDADEEAPGVFLFARKPADFVRRELSSHALYSILDNARVTTIPERIY